VENLEEVYLPTQEELDAELGIDMDFYEGELNYNRSFLGTSENRSDYESPKNK
jgi:hypothetical protein